MIFSTITDTISSIWHFQLYHAGDSFVTLGQVLSFLLIFTLIYFISFKTFNKIISRLFVGLGIKEATASRAGRAASYILFLLAAVATLQTFGIDMTSFSIVGGALGIGVGLGLQNITNNFIAGIIMFFEKPIKIGDRVELDNTQGNVQHISFRATSILTYDNITIIVPNSFFIQNKVINWSHSTHNIRVHLPIDVSYKCDPKHISATLLDIANATEGVLHEPAAEVRFLGFGESALNFELLIWTNTFGNNPAQLKSELYFSIFERFKTKNIELPFPQRDIHIINSKPQFPEA